MPIKEILIHIGFPKTGTTTLQNFFWQNRNRLSENSILYPNIGIVANAHHQLSPFHPRSKENGGPISAEILHEFLQNTKEKKILLSSELLAEEKKDFLENLISKLQKNYIVSAVLYIRRQDEFFDSLINQLCKQGSIDRIGDEQLVDLAKRFNYEELLQSWEHIVGLENLIVRSYDQPQFYKKDLCCDFMKNVLRINDMSNYKIPTTRLNNKLSFAAVEFKNLINSHSSDLTESNKYRSVLQDYCDTTKGATQDKKYVLPNETRQKILQQSTPSNFKIAARYMGKSHNESPFSSNCIEENSDTNFSQTLRELNMIHQHLMDRHPQLALELNKLLKIDPNNRSTDLQSLYEKHRETQPINQP